WSATCIASVARRCSSRIMSSGVRGKGSSRSASSEGNCHWGIEVVGCSRISIVGGTSSWKETLFALRLCLSSCSVISRATPFAPTHPAPSPTRQASCGPSVLACPSLRGEVCQTRGMPASTTRPAHQAHPSGVASPIYTSRLSADEKTDRLTRGDAAARRPWYACPPEEREQARHETSHEIARVARTSPPRARPGAGAHRTCALYCPHAPHRAECGAAAHRTAGAAARPYPADGDHPRRDRRGQRSRRPGAAY